MYFSKIESDKANLKPESAGGAHRHSCDLTALRLRFYGVQHGSDFPHLSCVTIGGSEAIAQKSWKSYLLNIKLIKIHSSLNVLIFICPNHRTKQYIDDILSFGHCFGHSLCLFQSALK